MLNLSCVFIFNITTVMQSKMSNQKKKNEKKNRKHRYATACLEKLCPYMVSIGNTERSIREDTVLWIKLGGNVTLKRMILYLHWRMAGLIPLMTFTSIL